MSNPRLQIRPPLSEQGLPVAVLACGLKPASDESLSEVQQLAEAQMGCTVAPLSALAALRIYASACILVFEEQNHVTGALGVLPLTSAGMDALLNERLDLATPRRGDVAHGFDRACALYAMGIAATSKQAARAVVSGVVRLRDTFATIPFYARPVTTDGRRVLVERLNCVPVPSRSLLMSPAARVLEAVA